jgi:hypothetical protein
MHKHVSLEIRERRLAVTQPLGYCAACLVQILMFETEEDRSRLDAIRNRWMSAGRFTQQQGLCARCCHWAQVSYPSIE